MSTDWFNAIGQLCGSTWFLPKKKWWFFHDWTMKHRLFGLLKFIVNFSMRSPPLGGLVARFTQILFKVMFRVEQLIWLMCKDAVMKLMHYIPTIHYIYIYIYLVGGLEHQFYFPYIKGNSSSQLTFLFFRDFHIFQRGKKTTNQYIYM